ncbi:hypothetical protein J3E69DRAFT_349362 [Trichoderma sp. SZMC 28015]
MPIQYRGEYVESSVPVLVHNIQSIRNTLCTIAASASLFSTLLLFLQAHAVNASSLCLRTSRGAATGGLHKVPRTRKHCQRSRGGAVPDTPSRMFRTCGPAMAAQPRLYRSSQPAIDFFLSVSGPSSLSC